METPRDSTRERDVTTNLHPLGQLSDYEVADDSVDVRGWKVTTSDDRTLGTVDDLLVDTQVMTTRHLLVDVDKEFGRTSKRVAIPVSRARIDENDRVVRVSMPATAVAGLTPYTGTLTADYDRTFTTAAPVTEPSRREPTTSRTEPAGTAEAKRLTRSAEELRINRREVPAGEVRVKKDVVTERVSQPVERKKEDVRVERRPASPTAAGRAEIKEDEIRVPITEEEVVVEKRPVVKEELVVAKEQTTERENVEADVRKERVDVDRVGRDETEHRRR